MSETNGNMALVVQSPRGIVTRDRLTEASEQRALLSEYVKRQMVENTDYGTIPGTPRPTLLKPGAEKLVDLFRCTPKFTMVRVVEDYDRNLFAYTFRVRLYQRDAEAVLAEGYGSANSREGRYRWRQQNRKCPKCSKETIIQGKAEYGGGWLCFAKKGGCGAKFKVGDKSIEGQETGQVENEDVATLANTILKMAKKRALVDGAIALARVSDLFTQDVEDTGHAPDEAPRRQSPARVTVHDNHGEPTTDDTLEQNLRASVTKGAATTAAGERLVSETKAPNPTDNNRQKPGPTGTVAQPPLEDVSAEEMKASEIIDGCVAGFRHHAHWHNSKVRYEAKDRPGLPTEWQTKCDEAYAASEPKE